MFSRKFLDEAKLKQNTTSGSDATGSSGTADDKVRTKYISKYKWKNKYKNAESKMCCILLFVLQTRDSSDYARVSAEVRQLRDGESQLRQENMQLKVRPWNENI